MASRMTIVAYLPHEPWVNNKITYCIYYQYVACDP